MAESKDLLDDPPRAVPEILEDICDQLRMIRHAADVMSLPPKLRDNYEAHLEAIGRLEEFLPKVAEVRSEVRRRLSESPR